MNIAITGVTGVLGRILQEQLMLKGYNQISCFTGDITRQTEVGFWIDEINPDALFHFAALVPVDLVNNEPFRAFEVNVGGTINLLSALKNKNKSPWFFYASTSHVYKSSDKPISETHTEEPINLYGTTKLMAEKACESFEKNLPGKICIGRIFSFYHVTQKLPFLYPSMMQRLQKEDLSVPFKLRGAACVRDIVNAEQIVTVILKLMEKKYSGKVNIAGGEGITIADFVRKISPKPIEIEAVDNDFNSLVADITKLKSIIKE